MQYERQSKLSCATKLTQLVFVFAANKSKDDAEVGLASSKTFYNHGQIVLENGKKT